MTQSQTVKPAWQTVPEQLQDWLSASAVQHCCFHRTGADFDSFDCTRSDLGAHFGGLELVSTLPRFDGFVEGDHIIPVWLRLERPLRLKDSGSFHSDGIALQLAAMGLLSKQEARAIHNECDKDFRQRKRHDAALRQIIVAAGYDSVVYRSLWDRVPGRCYIAFDPSQIAFALAVTDAESDSPQMRLSCRP